MTRKAAALLAVILASAAYTAFAELPAPGVLYPGYCGQQYPMLFAASLCGHVEPAGGVAVGRSIGTFVRGSNRSMQRGGIANPTWTELSTDQAGSWEHTDGLDYVIIEDVRRERACNNWFTFEDWPAARCSGCTAVREANTWGPGGQALRVNFSITGGTVWNYVFTGLAEGDWYSVCVYAWVESGTLDVRVRNRISGGAPQQLLDSDVTLTTTPTEYCVRQQDDGTGADNTLYFNVVEDPVGDGTGVDFLLGYVSQVTDSVSTTPIKNHVASQNCGSTQREADVLPFSTEDLSVESGEGHADVAWLNYAYDWPATPASHTIVELSFDDNWQILYHRPNATSNKIRFNAGGTSASRTVTFARGDVTRLEWRWRSGEPLELCVDGTCVLSAGNYTPPAAFAANGCWGCRNPDNTPSDFADAGLRNARIQ